MSRLPTDKWRPEWPVKKELQPGSSKNPDLIPKPLVKRAPIPELAVENNFFHKHALSVLIVRPEAEIACNVCGMTVYGEVYGCINAFHKKFYMHKICVNIPKTIHHPAHHTAPLYLRAYSSEQGVVKCKCCHWKCDFFHYHSNDNFNLHVYCAAKPLSLRYDLNITLHLCFNFPFPEEDATEICNICGRYLYTVSDWVYHNVSPKIITHHYCMRDISVSETSTLHKRLNSMVMVPVPSSSATTPTPPTPKKSFLSRFLGSFKS